MSYHEHAIFLRPASPFVPETFLHRWRGEVFEQVALRRIEALLTGEIAATPMRREGALFVSAVLFGALLDRRLWEQWNGASRGMVVDVEATTCFQKVRESDLLIARPVNRLFRTGRIYIDLGVPFGTKGKAEARRWVADPLTDALLLHWQAARAAALPATFALSDALVAFLGEEHRPSLEREGLLAALHPAAVARWQLRMPAFLVHAAGDSGDCVSLPAARWAALFAGMTTGSSPDRKPQEVKCHALKPRDACVREIAAHLPAGRAATPKAFVTAARQMRQDAVTQQQPVERLLMLWAADRIDPAHDPRQRTRRLAPSTVEARAKILAPLLRAACGTVDPVTLSAERWAAALNAAIGSKLTDVRKSAALSCFTDWLQRRVPHLTIAWDSRPPAEPSGVSAAIVTSREYALLRDGFDPSTVNGAMARILVSLGFRAGLRWDEAIGLRWDDLRATGDHLELTIRGNAARRLKTLASRRTVPLHLLLTDEERAELDAWTATRRAEAVAALPLGPADPLEHGRLFPTFGLPLHQGMMIVVQRALRAIIGPRKDIFHALRHSCGSYLLATLALPEDMEVQVPAIDPQLVSHERRLRLAPALLGAGTAGRGAVHGVGALLGHSGDRATTRSYMHLHDWLIGLHVARPSAVPRLTACTVAMLSGRSIEAVERAHRRALARERADGRDPARARRGRPTRQVSVRGTIMLSRFLDDTTDPVKPLPMPSTARRPAEHMPGWEPLAIWMLSPNEVARANAERQRDLATPLGRRIVAELRALIETTTRGRDGVARRRFIADGRQQPLTPREALAIRRLSHGVMALGPERRRLLVEVFATSYDRDRGLIRVDMADLIPVRVALGNAGVPISTARVTCAVRRATIRLDGGRALVWALLFAAARDRALRRDGRDPLTPRVPSPAANGSEGGTVDVLGHGELRAVLACPVHGAGIAGALIGCSHFPGSEPEQDEQNGRTILHVDTSTCDVVVDHAGDDETIALDHGCVVATSELSMRIEACRLVKRKPIALPPQVSQQAAPTPHRPLSTEAASKLAAQLRKDERPEEALDHLHRVRNRPMPDHVRARVLNQHSARVLDLLDRYGYGLMQGVERDLDDAHDFAADKKGQEFVARTRKRWRSVRDDGYSG